jgi:hypothetical protein
MMETPLDFHSTYARTTQLRPKRRRAEQRSNLKVLFSRYDCVSPISKRLKLEVLHLVPIPSIIFFAKCIDYCHLFCLVWDY